MNKLADVIILAGGFGTRMSKKFPNIPKPLIKINKTPIIEHLIIECKKNNFTNILISVYHQKEKIINYLGDGIINVNHVESNNYTNNNVPDRVRFKGIVNGIHAECDVSWYSPTRIRRTTILGTKGQIVWDQDQNTVTHYLNRVTDNRAIAVSPTVYIYDYDKSPLEYELEHFINCVKSRKQPTTNVNSALAVADTVDQVKNLLSK